MEKGDRDLKKRKFIKEDDFLHLEVWELEEKIGISWSEYLGEEKNEESITKEES